MFLSVISLVACDYITLHEISSFHDSEYQKYDFTLLFTPSIFIKLFTKK